MRLIDLTKDFTESVSYAGSGTNQPPTHLANVLMPVIRITVPKSRIYTFRHLGDLVLKLATGAGAEIPNNSLLVFGVRKPSSRSPQDITGAFTYAAFGNTPLTSSAGQKTQFDQETMAKRRISFLPGSDVQLSQDQMMELLVQSTSAISVANAASFFQWTVVESDVVTQVAA
jgi:hypothetical protein